MQEINTRCRPYYAVSSSSLPDLLKVFFNRDSPFWYRGYFMASKAGESLVDSTLAFYGCRGILVGHTILDSNIAWYYGGKVMGLDVDQHGGKSGAALYEGGKWYRVEEEGSKKLLI